MDGSHITALFLIGSISSYLFVKKDYFHAGVCIVCFSVFFILGLVQ